MRKRAKPNRQSSRQSDYVPKPTDLSSLALGGFLAALAVVTVGTLVSEARADERRAPAPKFQKDQLKGIFFEDLSEAFRGERPSLASIRQAGTEAMLAQQKSTAKGQGGGSKDGGVWVSLISPPSIEDEIKAVRLRYDGVITTPGKFNSGGYQDARLNLSILATLFGVITEYGGEVRWKDEAPVARDLIARTAFNCKAGSTQVYNEAKLRKADLQDLMSGTGLAERDAEQENDWSMIADRSPLMEYAEMLIEALEDKGSDDDDVQENSDEILRHSELLAMLGEVLTKEGMDDAGDEDYDKLSRDMTIASQDVVAALKRSDWSAAGTGISTIRTKCDACHEQYR